MNQQKIIGIDLGTTNSCVAVIEGGKPVVIRNSEGYFTTPSVVAFGKGGDRMVGQIAKRQAITNPERTIQSIKRHMGSNRYAEIDERSFSPEQISAIILQKLKAQAEAHLGERVKRAIITVPAYFNDAQRLATRDAGQVAGLEVVRIINEPTACALTYGFKRLNDDSKIVIFDFGGGTFDVTILQLSDQVLQVRATNGNNELGGDDFDQRIIEWLNNQFKVTHGINLSEDRMAMQRLKEAAEKAKIDLSTRSSTEINLPFLAQNEQGPLHLETTLFLQEFNEMTADLVRAVAEPIKTALADSKFKQEDIDQVILVGGTTRIPAVQQFIRGFFGKEPVKSVNPDEAVAMGAAIQGGILTGEIKEVLLLDVVPMTLGLELGDGRVDKVFERNTNIPASKTRVFTTAVADQSSIHVHVVQGEDCQARKNISLARFDLDQIPALPAGTPRIEVTFNVDVDGILSCTANYGPGKAIRPVALHRTNGLSREILDRMARESELMAEMQRLQQERMAATVMAESTLADASRTLKKYAGLIDHDKLEEVNNATVRLQCSMNLDDTGEIERLTEALELVLFKCVRAASATRTSPAA